MHLQHGNIFLQTLKIAAENRSPCDYGDNRRSPPARERENHLSPVRRNVFFKFIIPAIIKYSPKCIISEASNPVDILIYITWKLSG